MLTSIICMYLLCIYLLIKVMKKPVGQFFPPKFRQNQLRAESTNTGSSLGFSNVARTGISLMRKQTEVQQPNFGKQQNIITNLRSDLTSLKQQVGKLMSKEESIQGLQRKQSNGIKSVGNSFSINNPPFQPNSNNYYIMHRADSNDQRMRDKNNSIKNGIEIYRDQAERLMNENQKLKNELKDAYGRQQQLLNDRSHYLETNRGKMTDRQQMIRKSYQQEIENLNNTINNLQRQTQRKKKISEFEKNKIVQLENQLSSKNNYTSVQFTQDNQHISSLKTQIIHLNLNEKQLQQKIDKKQNENYSLKLQIKAQQQLNDNLKKTDKKQAQIVELSKQIQDLNKSNKLNHQKLDSYQVTIKKLSNDLQKFDKDNANLIKENKQIKHRLVNQIKGRDEKIVQVSKQVKKLNLIIKDLQEKLKHFSKEEISQKLQQQQRVEKINKNFEEEQHKNQLKQKEKIIISLRNDMKQMQNSLRQFNNNLNMIKNLNGVIQSQNQQSIKSQLSKLNEKYSKLI